MSQLVNYSIIEAGLRALADKAHESAVAQAEGKPIPCGLSENDMELVALLTAMMNDTQANKGWCANEMGKSIASTGVVVNTNNVVFSFKNHAFVNANYRGTIFVNLMQAIPTGTTGTLPILFETNGSTQAVTKYNEEPLTVADVLGTGVYQFWFERDTNTLQMMSGIV